MRANQRRTGAGRSHDGRLTLRFDWPLEALRGLTNFAACEGSFLAVTWWLGFSMAFNPLVEFQMAILLFASHRLPWIFVAGYAMYLYVFRASPWRTSYVVWFLPGLAIGAVSANFFLMINCLQ